MLAVAISVYDRWLELGGLLEVLRLNWHSGRDLYITVSSTAEEKDMPVWINRVLIDHIEFGSPYPMPKWDPLGWVQQWKKITLVQQLREKYMTPIIRARTVESIIRSCRQGMVSGADYTLHLHAAAWPFKEEKIYEIIDTMKARKAVIGCRGYGKKYIDAKRPEGDMDDNFFIIDNSFAQESQLWKFDPAKDAPTVSNEGRLARRVYQVCSEKQIYYYDQFQKAEEYDYPPGTDQRRVQPYNYHIPTGLLRSHDMRWQAKLCAEFGYHGPVLDQLVATYINQSV